MMEFFTSIGSVDKIYTTVDYYTYIKGLEYLICVGFFVVFPMFYRYIHGGRDDT